MSEDELSSVIDSITTHVAVTGMVGDAPGLTVPAGKFTLTCDKTSGWSVESTASKNTVNLTSNGNYDVDFGKFSFDAVGDYTFTVQEDSSILTAGWSCGGDATFKVSVVERDVAGKSTLVATVTEPGIISNTFTPAMQSGLAVKDIRYDFNEQIYIYANLDFPPGSFTITQVNGIDATTTSGDGWMVGSLTNTNETMTPAPIPIGIYMLFFGAVTDQISSPHGPDVLFTKPGKYTFTVVENNADKLPAGWTPTVSTGTFVYDVKEDQSTHKLTVGYNADESQWLTNTLVPAGIRIFDNTEIIKLTATGMTEQSPDLTIPSGKISYSCDKTEGWGYPGTLANGNEIDVTDNGDYDIWLGILAFDAVGDYTFTLHEDPSVLTGGWSCSGDATFKVSVTEGPNKTLVANVTKAGALVNTYYSPVVVTTPDVNVAKAISSSTIDSIPDLNIPAGDFALTCDKTIGWSGAAASLSDLVVTGNGDCPINFGDIEFSKVGDYTFTVSESAADLPAKWSCNDGSFTVRVTEGDNNTLVATVVNSVPVTNVYTLDPTTFNAQITNTVSGDDPPEVDNFSFIITGNGSAPMPADAVDGKVTRTISGAGMASIGDITATVPGTYTYTIAEIAGANAHYTYDDAVYTMTVVVSDNGKGCLMSTTTYKKANGVDVSGLAFDNVYTVDNSNSDAENSSSGTTKAVTTAAAPTNTTDASATSTTTSTTTSTAASTPATGDSDGVIVSLLSFAFILSLGGVFSVRLRDMFV
jgi:pilin isopeptide linkage protein